MSRSWACATACGCTSKPIPFASRPRSQAPMPTPEIVRATGVTKGFAASGGRGRTGAVRGGNVGGAQGELAVLRGRSGPGKGTLITLVAGRDNPDAGGL